MIKDREKEEIKIVVMGSQDVGKTTLMENLLDNVSKVEHNGTTVAIDYGKTILNGKKVHFFGTPGQEKFEFMREIALTGADFVIVVLDGSVGLRNVDKKIIDVLNTKKIPYIVFINKMDLCEDCEKIKQLKDYIRELNEENGQNCKDIFEGSILNGNGTSELMDFLKNKLFK
ncbi:MAG: uncharacterized protein PWP15_814 [Methanothermococcus sp.]|jgi:hypothetical protein|uniref:GTPase domain-containing protein n=1 Tax=Methanothermococcus TaxID=155862 RepID=UPI00035F5274|nr:MULTISPECIES: GTP-binding protein [Methanothermococcus]MDK2790307.1 uncharacterized protein [Methanothermococcus sp.]MDK2987813.1 uncharacterized protein [Methanothermococcus sp.]